MLPSYPHVSNPLTYIGPSNLQRFTCKMLQRLYPIHQKSPLHTCSNFFYFSIFLIEREECVCVIWGVGVSTLRCGGWRTPAWRWFPPSHLYTCSRLQLKSLGLYGKCFPLQSHLANLDPGLVSLFETEFHSTVQDGLALTA